MRRANQTSRVSDEDRREFLKAVGATGLLASGGVALSELRDHVTVSNELESEFESITLAIESAVGAELDASLLAEHQGAFASAASALPDIHEKGLPTEETVRTDFQQIAALGKPVYDHLATTGFFGSSTAQLPNFTPDFLTSVSTSFTASKSLVDLLSDLGLSGALGTDLVATVVANSEELSQYHWVATDQINREQFEIGEHIPSMTRSVTGGTLLWLEDLDEHLWTHSVLLTDAIYSDAIWHAQSMAAGFHLVTEGAKAIAERASGDTETHARSDIGITLTIGFATQAIAHGLLPQDVYWITEDMRAPRQSGGLLAPVSTTSNPQTDGTSTSQQ